MKKAARSILAVVIGYLAMVVLITLAQETLLGGVSFQRSSLTTLAVGGALTFCAAVVGGLVAGWIAGRKPLWHGAVMCVMVAVETTALLIRGVFEGPLWFDLMASASLMVGILAGAWWIGRRSARPELAR